MNFDKLITESLYPNILRDAIFFLKENLYHGFLNKDQVNTLSLKYSLEDHNLAIILLDLAAKYSSPLVSNFHVGAIAIGESGNFYFGANQEFLSLPIQYTIHAEQSALSHAFMMNEVSIKKLIISAPPCGHCRQFINELNSASSILIYLKGYKNSINFKELLPISFGPKDLGINYGLFDKFDLGIQKHFDKKEMNILLKVFNKSYAPYAKKHSAIAFKLKNELICGSIIENAAFNPSLNSLSCTLSFLKLKNRNIKDILEIYFIEMKSSLSELPFLMDFIKENCLDINPVIEFIESF
ncbi:MAG: cytidine deaminase [Psittacicella sp.]